MNVLRLEDVDDGVVGCWVGWIGVSMGIVVICSESNSRFAVTCRVLVVVSGIIVSAMGVVAGRGGGIQFGGCCGWCSASIIVVSPEMEVVGWYVGGGSAVVSKVSS